MASTHTSSTALKSQLAKSAKAVRKSSAWQRLQAGAAAVSATPGTTPASPGAEVNPLEAYFEANQGRLIHKWMHYFDIYHRHFRQFRNQPITVVEFGVSQGGSLQMWKNYFGPKARIIGVDIEPKCANLEEDQIEIMIGDQDDRDFLKTVAARAGSIDVLIEDGGHTMTQQIATFEELWPSIAHGGVFLMEDLHTSYWDRYGGGLKRPDTFIEYAKNLIDAEHAWYSEDKSSFAPDAYTRSIRGMHVYDSIIVFDKARVPKPTHRKTGTPSF